MNVTSSSACLIIFPFVSKSSFFLIILLLKIKVNEDFLYMMYMIKEDEFFNDSRFYAFSFKMIVTLCKRL